MGTLAAHDYPAHWEADVVLRDGGTAQIRPITPDDADRLVAFYARVSDESKYFRFFAPYPRLSDRDVHRFTHHDYVDRVGLAATVGDEFIATVRYDRIAPADGAGQQAEVAFLVQDGHQGRGVASALLEHIAACARERGIRRFAAEVLPGNMKMIKVFTDAGYTQKQTFEDGVVRLEFDLEPTERSVAVLQAREQRAEARSVRRLLAPRSVAVVGTGRRSGGVGRTVLRNLLAAGFTGRAYAVNTSFDPAQHRLEPEGVPAYRSVRDVDGPVDLAVIAVPAAQVPAVVADCGEHGVQGLTVLTSGYTDAGPQGRGPQRELVRQAHSYGMRIIGPNAFGLISTAPGVRLNASLSPVLPDPGSMGLFTQSGAIGIALLTELQRRAGAGISTFVSAGNRADVSGNDFLQFWHDDPGTDVVLMYLESIGNPRKFTRLAKRTAERKPVVVVKGARHTGAAPPSHAVPAAGIPSETVSALLRQAGVISADTVTDLVDTGLLLAAQPLPRGARVAILGNSESLGLLTYDACLTQGLRPLRPRDLTTGATPESFRTALAGTLAGDDCDAVVVTAIPWVADPDLPALTAAPGPHDAESLAVALRAAVDADEDRDKPVAVVYLAIDGLPEALASGTHARSGDPDPAGPDVPADPPGPDTRAGRGEPDAPAGPPRATIPAYPSADRAARAIAEAVGYARWRRDAAQPGLVPEYDDIDEPGAAADIKTALDAATPGPEHAASDHGSASVDSASPSERSDRPGGRTLPERPGQPGGHTLLERPGQPGERPHLERPDQPGERPHSERPDQPGERPLFGRLGRPEGGTGGQRGPRAAPPPPHADPARPAEPGSYTLPAYTAPEPHTDGSYTDLDTGQSAALLARYGIRVLPARPAPDPDAAVEAAAGLGYPVALKTTAAHLRHRPDLGGVRLDLTDEDTLRRAYRELTDTLGKGEELGLVVQAMAPRGVDTVVRAAVDPVAGAVLSFGLAGAPSELLGDVAHRLIPATDRDVAGLVRSLRSAPLLFGWRGARAVDTAALEEVLLRLSRLVDDHPEVLGAELSPVVVAPHGAAVLGASVRLAPPPPRTDLGARRLPLY